MDTVQANESGECPTGHKACTSPDSNSETKWYDVYCLPEADYPAKCPIYSIDILKEPKSQDDIDKSQGYTLQSWKSVPFSTNYELWYTNGGVSSAPIGKTFVGRGA